MKLLIMQFSPASCHFIPLCSKYFPEHLSLKRLQSMFSPSARDQVSHPYMITVKVYSSVYFNHYVFRQKTSRRKVLTEGKICEDISI
jgi:hypothetical protein